MLNRAAWYYKPYKRSDNAVRIPIVEIANTRVRYGVNRIHVLLRREGWKDNKKRIHRIYKEEGLNLRSKRPRRSKVAVHRMERPKDVIYTNAGQWILWLTNSSMGENLGS